MKTLECGNAVDGEVQQWSDLFIAKKYV
jgi:hypothetical protein